MSLWETVRIAVRALSRNTLRSFLTALGIIIGVGAVIAMVAIGEGAKARVEEAFASMGTNLLVLMPGSSASRGVFGGSGSLPTLTWADLKAIQEEVTDVRQAAPYLRTTAQVVSEEQNWTTSVCGTTPEYFDIRSWPMSSGAAFTSSDVDTGAKVAVLGRTVVDKLYGPNADPVGQAVRIKNMPFQVVGVMVRKGQSPTGQDYDDAVLIPVSTYRAKIQGGLQNYIAGSVFVSAVSSDATARTERRVRALLRDRHHLSPEAEDDFQIRNLTEIASAQQEGTRTLTTLLASIAAVSLLVGGIGIMNIMLVSVTERTREIGVRMAVGAKPRHILAQFLVEALSLSVLGGFAGVGLGLLAANRLAAQFGWPMLMRADIILIALGFSGLVGVGFGLYPAHRASRLDPIEALRYE
ncbi:MAG: multidrug ABC transporter substrate-binding protein [Acidobacteria bacterium]|nr:MAG: multidrug ABC transporter substrate-binding protein [Acidobacteriota bacterium]